MDLVKLLNDLVTNIASLQLQLIDAQRAAEALADAKYNEGFKAGVASVDGVVSDKIYSQKELDQKIIEAIAPIQAQLDIVKLQFEQLKADVDAKIKEGITIFKSNLLEKYIEQQVAETQAETGFAELLK